MADDVKGIRTRLYVLYSLIFIGGIYLAVCGRTASGVIAMSSAAFMALAVHNLLRK